MQKCAANKFPLTWKEFFSVINFPSNVCVVVAMKNWFLAAFVVQRRWKVNWNWFPNQRRVNVVQLLQSIQFFWIVSTFSFTWTRDSRILFFRNVNDISTRQRRRSRMDWIPLIRQNWSEKMNSHNVMSWTLSTRIAAGDFLFTCPNIKPSLSITENKLKEKLPSRRRKVYKTRENAGSSFSIGGGFLFSGKLLICRREGWVGLRMTFHTLVWALFRGDSCLIVA